MSTQNAFERVLADFKKELSEEELTNFDGTTLNDLQAHIDALQREQAKRKTMQNLTRIQGFLEAMESYSKVLDVFVNVHNFVAFIWVYILSVNAHFGRWLMIKRGLSSSSFW
jgi:site-specific recombinase XerD